MTKLNLGENGIDQGNGERGGMDWQQNVKGLVRRVLNPDVALEGEVADFDYAEKPGAVREITEEEEIDFKSQHFHLDLDLIFYREQRELLKKKYLELVKEIDKKIARCEAGKQRLSEILLYGKIVVPVSTGEAGNSQSLRATKPTTILTESQRLREQDAQRKSG